MAWIDPRAVERQRQRWMRHDAHRYMRPDAHRGLRPDAYRWMSAEELQTFYPEYYRSLQPKPRDRKFRAAPSVGLAAARDAADEQMRRELVSILHWAQSEFANLHRELALRRKAYNPNQPRMPVGNPDGGQWTSEGREFDRIRLAQVGGTLTDAWGDRYYNPGGHHEFPKSIYRKWNLRPETRQVFERATTGTIPEMGVRTTPEGPAYRNA
jgi:hypothetical protein